LPNTGYTRPILTTLALALAYYAAARFGLLLAFSNTNVSPVWPPSGIALAALMLLGLRTWPGVLLGAVAANYTAFVASGALAPGAALGLSFVIGLGNSAEAIAGAWMLRRWLGPHLALDKPERVYLFAAVAVLVSAIAALAGTASLVLWGVLPATGAQSVGATWWMGDLAGIAIVTPFVLAWRRPGLARRRGWRARAGAIAGLVLLAAVLASVFGPAGNGAGEASLLVYILLPGVGWAAYRFGMRGATLMLMLAAGAAVAGTTHGYGPFARGTLNESLFALEVFIGLCSMVGMVLAADVEGRAARRTEGVSWTLELLHWVTLYACLTLTIAAWQYVSGEIERRAGEQFAYEVDNIKRRIGERIDTYAALLTSGQAMFASADKVTREDWANFVQIMDIKRKYPAIDVFGAARRVSDKAALERAMQAAGEHGFRVWPPGERDDYVVSVYVEPVSGANRRALGFDLKSEPARRAALVRAMESGQMAVTSHLRLVQENGAAGEAGFLMVLPLFRHGAPAATWQQRSEALDGYVVVAFRLADLMQGLLANQESEVALEIFDGRSTSPEDRMFSNLDPGHGAAYSGVAMVGVGDTSWTVRVSSRAAFEAGVDRQKPLIVLFAGTLIGLLFFSMIRALTATREEALAQALQMSGALRASERRFGMLVDSASEFAIIGTDPAGKVNVFSVGAERMLGYAAAEIIGGDTPFQLHLPEEVIARGIELSHELGRPVSGFDVFVAKARMKQADTREWTYVRKDGSTLPVQLTITPILDAAGEVGGFVAIGRDVTEQKRAEGALRDAMHQADAASRAKSDFVANMSHELRTPLNAVLGIAYLLARTPLTVDQRRDLDLIRSSGNALLVILNDILDFSKIEAGKMELEPAPFRVEDMVAKLASIMGISARQHDLELTIEVDPALPAVLVGDVQRLQQVLVNLAGNAIKFTERGGVAVRLSASGSSGELVDLQIDIEDTGIGMSQPQLARLFTAFTQADSSMTRRFGGTGLGLTISRRLVELMNGAIDVNSVAGVGSKFTVHLRLPVAPDERVDLGWRYRVLVVGGHAASARVLCAMVAGQGWHAAGFADAGAALAAAPHAADLVLLDWGALGGDPVATIRALRIAAGAAVVLMVSSYERDNTQLDPGALGADDVLDKPVTMAPLRATLQNMQGRRPGAHLLADGDPAAAQVLAGVRLLLVEDNELNQVVAKGMLEGAGAEVEIAGDGQVAVELLRAQPARFDLVLLDIQMPVMDGFEAIRLIRGELGLRLPVLAMTAGVMERERDRCIAAGMNGFIAKPVDVQLMLATIRRHLPLHQQGDTAYVPPPAAGQGVFDLAPLMGAAPASAGHLAPMTGMIARMVGTGLQPVDNALAAWREGRANDAAAAMHTLRGSIGSLGAHRFAAACLALEQALPGEGKEGVETLFGPVRRELAATLEAAAQWLAALPPAAQRVSHAVPDEQLALFGRLLSERNMAACTLFEQFAQDLPLTLGEARAARMRAAMNVLDFDTAIAVLDEG
jgi:PAS domain S-box-containing protein